MAVLHFLRRGDDHGSSVAPLRLLSSMVSKLEEAVSRNGDGDGDRHRVNVYWLETLQLIGILYGDVRQGEDATWTRTALLGRWMEHVSRQSIRGFIQQMEDAAGTSVASAKAVSGVMNAVDRRHATGIADVNARRNDFAATCPRLALMSSSVSLLVAAPLQIPALLQTWQSYNHYERIPLHVLKLLQTLGGCVDRLVSGGVCTWRELLSLLFFRDAVVPDYGMANGNVPPPLACGENGHLPRLRRALLRYRALLRLSNDTAASSEALIPPPLMPDGGGTDVQYELLVSYATNAEAGAAHCGSLMSPSSFSVTNDIAAATKTTNLEKDCADVYFCDILRWLLHYFTSCLLAGDISRSGAFSQSIDRSARGLSIKKHRRRTSVVARRNVRVDWNAQSNLSSKHSLSVVCMERGNNPAESTSESFDQTNLERRLLPLDHEGVSRMFEKAGLWQFAVAAAAVPLINKSHLKTEETCSAAAAVARIIGTAFAHLPDSSVDRFREWKYGVYFCVERVGVSKAYFEYFEGQRLREKRCFEDAVDQFLDCAVSCESENRHLSVPSGTMEEAATHPTGKFNDRLPSGTMEEAATRPTGQFNDRLTSERDSMVHHCGGAHFGILVPSRLWFTPLGALVCAGEAFLNDASHLIAIQTGTNFLASRKKLVESALTSSVPCCCAKRIEHHTPSISVFCDERVVCPCERNRLKGSRRTVAAQCAALLMMQNDQFLASSWSIQSPVAALALASLWLTRLIPLVCAASAHFDLLEKQVSRLEDSDEVTRPHFGSAEFGDNDHSKSKPAAPHCARCELERLSVLGMQARLSRLLEKHLTSEPGEFREGPWRSITKRDRLPRALVRKSEIVVNTLLDLERILLTFEFAQSISIEREGQVFQHYSAGAEMN